MTPYVLHFVTYKKNGVRVIKLLSANAYYRDGENNARWYYDMDNGFLLYTFWKAAKYAGIDSALK